MNSRKVFFFSHIGYILFIGICSTLFWIGSMEAVCQAQEQLPDNAAMPAAPKNPFVPGNVSPGQVPVMPGQKLQVVPQEQSLPKAERAGQTSSSSLSAPFSPAVPGSPLDMTKPANLLSPAATIGMTMIAAPQKGMVTLNFDDADVFTIIQTIFGNVLKVNYVVDPRIKGRVTFRAVAPVPMENVLPLMEVILRLNGIGIVEESGLYRLVPISDISREPSPVSYGRDPEKIQVKGSALLQVVPILYVQSSDVLKLITPFASSNAVLIDVPKSSQIIIVGHRCQHQTDAQACGDLRQRKAEDDEAASLCLFCPEQQS